MQAVGRAFRMLQVKCGKRLLAAGDAHVQTNSVANTSVRSLHAPVWKRYATDTLNTALKARTWSRQLRRSPLLRWTSLASPLSHEDDYKHRRRHTAQFLGSEKEDFHMLQEAHIDHIHCMCGSEPVS